MKRFVVFFYLFISGFLLFSLDIEALFRIGNLEFPDAMTKTSGFTGLSYPWGYSVAISHDFTYAQRLELEVIADPILRNIAYTRFLYTQDYLSIGIGPFVGFLNSSQYPLKTGLSTSIKLSYPGIIFAQYRTDNTIGDLFLSDTSPSGALTTTGDYFQQRNDISVGFYVFNSICSLNILSKKLSLKQKDDILIDFSTEYSFKADIYQKNRAYRILLSFGFEQLSKSWISGTTTVKDSLNSLIVDALFSAMITKYLTFTVDLRSSIYSFGSLNTTALTSPGPGGYMFMVTSGFSLDFDPFIQ